MVCKYAYNEFTLLHCATRIKLGVSVIKFDYIPFTCCVSGRSLQGSDLQIHSKKYVVDLHEKLPKLYVNGVCKTVKNTGRYDQRSN